MKNFTLLFLLAITMAGQAQSTIPQNVSGSKFSINCANLYFEIDSAVGARISSFKINDSELLYTNNSSGMHGSTFWPSPQSVWNWPPLVNLDSKPYKTTIFGNKITFAGSTDSKTSLRFYKTMYSNSNDTSIIIEYTMKNEKSSAQSWAPWEVTRVVGKGLTVFAKGNGSLTGILGPSTEEVNGYVWYDQDKNIVNKSGTYKFICDGKGWLAHVIDGNKLFIKKFNDIKSSDAAPAEAEVEVYTTLGNTYTELEDQGAYVSIASKDSTTWKVKWFARILPASVDVSVGSTSLTSYIESVINRSTDPVAKNDIRVKGSIKVFPNPATDNLVVETNLVSFKNISLCVYDLQGKMVMTQALVQNQQNIAIKNLSRGNYIFVLKQNEKSIGRGQISVTR